MNGFSFTIETEIVVPWERVVRVNPDGTWEVDSDRVPMHGQLSASWVWNAASVAERREIERETEQKVREEIEKHAKDL